MKNHGKLIAGFFLLLTWAACRHAVQIQDEPWKIPGGRFLFEQTLKLTFYSKTASADYEIRERIHYQFQPVLGPSTDSEITVLEDQITLGKSAPFTQTLFDPIRSKKMKFEKYLNIPATVSTSPQGFTESRLLGNSTLEALRKQLGEDEFQKTQTVFCNTMINPLVKHHQMILTPLLMSSPDKDKEVSFDLGRLFDGCRTKLKYRWVKTEAKSLLLSELSPCRKTFEASADGLFVGFPAIGKLTINDPQIKASVLHREKGVRAVEMVYKTGPLPIGTADTDEGFRSIEVRLKITREETGP